MQPQDLANAISMTTDEAPSFTTEEFTFELEELDGNRAMALVIALDPPECHC